MLESLRRGDKEWQAAEVWMMASWGIYLHKAIIAPSAQYRYKNLLRHVTKPENCPPPVAGAWGKVSAFYILGGKNIYFKIWCEAVR